MRIDLVFVLATVFPTVAAAELDCLDWAEPLFWEEATNRDVRKCLDEGVDIKARSGEYGEMPLHLAAREGTALMVLALLDAGADVDARDVLGWTPLHEAARHGTALMVLALVEAGADVDARTESGETPLHRAAGSPAGADIVRVLAEAGADVDAPRSEDGATPIHRAVNAGNLEMVQALAEAGADVEARSENGDTPMQLAGRICNWDALPVLTELGASPMHVEAARGCLSCLIYLLRVPCGWAYP